MDYTISKNIDRGFDEAVQAVTDALKEEGFGVITEVDLKDKFKEKLGIDFRNYKILGACNPAMAHKAIELEDRIGVMLPCNVLVQEKDGGKVEISAINPLSSIGATGNEQLQSVASEVSERLRAAVEKV